MCGGYGTRRLTWRQIATLARLTAHSSLPDFPEADRFPMRKRGKSPTDRNRAPIIRARDERREAVEAVWGLVPFWWSKPLSEKAFDTFNAKVEWVHESASYRHTLRSQRCLVPAAWFYESTGPKGAMTRHKCGLESGPILLLGLWDYHETLELLSFTILTTAPGERFRAFHHRVPGYAATAEEADRYLTGSVDEAIAVATQSNGDNLIIDPPAPATAT